ncbi:AAEL011194-PA [Aedes aegypti]|uniref:AAEL011194-PA n=1 Tax=Aedes aegypti TaxID=7159 RepID=Q16QS8_AEDAE|nr:AAEL011194-PA [Aedes aegypti]
MCNLMNLIPAMRVNEFGIPDRIVLPVPLSALREQVYFVLVFQPYIHPFGNMTQVAVDLSCKIM